MTLQRERVDASRPHLRIGRWNRGTSPLLKNDRPIFTDNWLDVFCHRFGLCEKRTVLEAYLAVRFVAFFVTQGIAPEANSAPLVGAKDMGLHSFLS